jgi:predicted nucleic-acid-binding protein
MIGLDTNVVARLLLADDAGQTQRAIRFLKTAQARGIPVLLTLEVIQELEWVLRSSAKKTKLEFLGLVRQLLEARDIEIYNESVLEQALRTYEKSTADFGECLFLAHYQQLGCHTMLTFDTKAARMTGVEMVAG